MQKSKIRGGEANCVKKNSKNDSSGFSLKAILLSHFFTTSRYHLTFLWSTIFRVVKDSPGNVESKRRTVVFRKKKKTQRYSFRTSWRFSRWAILPRFRLHTAQSTIPGVDSIPSDFSSSKVHVKCRNECRTVNRCLQKIAREEALSGSISFFFFAGYRSRFGNSVLVSERRRLRQRVRLKIIRIQSSANSRAPFREHGASMVRRLHDDRTGVREECSTL